MKNFIKNNIKLFIVLAVVILISVVGATLALTLRFGPTNININTANVVANIRYEEDENQNQITSITSSGGMIPITLDTSNIANVTNSSSVVKFKFWVSGNSSNPNNSIYDISLNNITMDCELKSPYMKWVLYKNNTLLYNGNFSPTFDIMSNNRMVLTTTQQDLTPTEDEYLLVLYIEDSCSNSDVSTCTSALDQSSLLGRSFSANIAIETATKTKKTNIRTTGEEVICTENNTSVTKPSCTSKMVYDGTNQLLLSAAIPTGITVNQSTATDAGDYTITATLSSGYKWSDNDSANDYIFTCTINKRSITISTQNQLQGSFISSPAKVDVTNLVTGHTINSIELSTISASGGDVITAGNATIFDTNSNDVTNNYIINYQSTGKIVE